MVNCVNGSRKGSAFERDVCKRLSLWFSKNTSETLFWRTAGSGARSTSRAKSGKSTANSAGDIGYLDAAGKPLIEAITFELKCGYSKADTTSLIDTLPSRKKPQLLEFIRQAVESGRNAQSKYWSVIHRRNSKQTLIHFPFSMWELICRYDQYTTDAMAKRCGSVQFTYVPVTDDLVSCVVSMPFDRFLEVVYPDTFFEF